MVFWNHLHFITYKLLSIDTLANHGEHRYKFSFNNTPLCLVTFETTIFWSEGISKKPWFKRVLLLEWFVTLSFGNAWKCSSQLNCSYILNLAKLKTELDDVNAACCFCVGHCISFSWAVIKDLSLPSILGKIMRRRRYVHIVKYSPLL